MNQRLRRPRRASAGLLLIVALPLAAEVVTDGSVGPALDLPVAGALVCAALVHPPLLFSSLLYQPSRNRVSAEYEHRCAGSLSNDDFRLRPK